MKNIIIAVVFVVVALTATFAVAEDIMLQVTPTEIVDAVDKNGNPFKRIVFEEEKELNGVKYNSSSIIIAFQNLEAVDALTIGQPAKLIVNKREYQGRDSYTLLAIVK